MADTLRIKYAFPTSALPVIADRNGEIVGNWVSNGNHTITADATHHYTGTKSLKIAASATGDFTTNFADLPSGNMPTFVVGKTYSVGVWVYPSDDDPFVVVGGASTTLRIKTGGVTSSVLTSYYMLWTYIQFTFTASSPTTALQIALAAQTGGGACSVWFELDFIRQYSDIPLLAIHGMLSPDRVSIFPAIINEGLDGSTETQFKAFRRKISIDCYAIGDASAEEKAILYWHLDNDRRIDYGTEVNINLGLLNADYELTWDNETRLTKRWQEDFIESTARTVFPV